MNNKTLKTLGTVGAIASIVGLFIGIILFLIPTNAEDKITTIYTGEITNNQQIIKPKYVKQENTNSQKTFQYNVKPEKVIQQNINQQRKIIPKPETIQNKRNGKFILLVMFNQTKGLWDSGTILKIELKLTGSYENSDFVRGISKAQNEFSLKENKQEGIFLYSSTTPPFPGQPIIIEFVSENKIALDKFNVEPK